MTSQTNNSAEGDQWLTVADFAQRMHVKPVTVRSWIAKGRLKATRSGERKWLIRNSELARMLHQDDGGAFLSSMPQTEEEFEARTQAALDSSNARYEWTVAVELSRLAPPDARFATRIRQIAQAASWRAAAIRNEVESGRKGWNPLNELEEDGPISYELRPDGNRPGPRDAWERFDRIVVRLRSAMKGESSSAVATAFDDLASAMNELADALITGKPKDRR